MVRLLCTFWMWSSLASAASIYTWVDGGGVKHFAAQPPAGQSVQVVAPSQNSAGLRLDSGAPEAAASDPQQHLINQQVRQQVAQDQVRLQQLCTDWRMGLAQLENNPRVRSEQNGQMLPLSESARADYLATLQNNINTYCQGRARD